MTEPNHRPTPDILDQAAEALRNTRVSPGPSTELTAATVAALSNRLADPLSAEVHRRERRRRIMRYVRYGSAASIAAGLLIAAGVLWLGSGTAAAFHRAADKAAAAKTVVCKHTQKIGNREMPFRAYYRADAYRMELLPPDGTETPVMAIVADLKAGKGLQINITSKTVKRLSGPAAGAFPNLIEQFQKLKGKEAELVGEEKINGQPTKVYRVKAAELLGIKPGGKDELRVWIDPKTELPVRVRADIRSSKLPQQFTWEEFRWNEKLDPKLFSLDVPKGYTVEGDEKPTQPESEPETGPTQFILLRRAMGNADKAKSVRVRINMQSGGKVTGKREVYRQGDLIRSVTTKDPMNNSWSVAVADLKTRQALMLNPKDKTARRTILGTQEVRAVSGLLGGVEDIKEQLSGGREDAVKDLGFEKLGDRRMNVYGVVAKTPPTGNWTIWVNPKTSLPVRAQAVMGDEGNTTLTLDYDDWNKEFDPKLFSRNVPKGYKLSDTPLEHITPPEPVPPEQVTLILFRRAMDNAEKATSMRALFSLDIGSGQQKLELKLYQQGKSMRAESINPALVVVLSGKKALVLLPQVKTAQWLDPQTDPVLSKAFKSDVLNGWPRLMGQMKEGKFAALPDETLDGRKVKVYEQKGLKMATLKGTADLKVWVDPKKLLPVRAQIRLQQKDTTITGVMNVLGWNEELDPKLFNLDVPKGYKVIEKPK